MFIKTTQPQHALIEQLLPVMVQACDILNQEFQQYCSGATFDVEKKNDNSPVTQADYRVNHYLTQALAEISTLPLLSEEGEQSQRQAWHEFWLLDPLDGTKEFLHQRPEFTINLSLIRGAVTTFAVLAVPGEHNIYFCPEQGMPLKYHILTQQWYVYQANDHTTSILNIGLSHSSQSKPQYSAYLQALAELTEYVELKAGSAYKFCMILEDRVDIYPRFHPTSEWDTSAGQCLLERIGGGLVDFQGRAFLYNQRDTLLNGGFIAYKNAKMKQIALQALGLMAK
ncbi:MULTISPECIES: 3'(2'),5'-bisphosphate nucleotidase CysQ [unclassified Acinetobacter]|jgi:3'(2'), 5'-bisphosphate nucleotidase|uniref:3'(2'),5'-bisphosphate nucleotidase CysQ family protein n=1 Tax=unclassified Acinetobacter TaxID=196816 RepID=UPI001446CDF8|nr:MULTISPECIES: 3'(2'),5'-bisphosphate nucleotidase CysQ [unclassified Acinetobacter]NLN59027.1 3'(2'),5'-bisphosphate nucleotidase CysQ [Gammaproteobacteria bacterium]